MKKLLWVFAALMLLAPCAAWAQTGGKTYYVSAAGNDDNDGLTEATAFKTLVKGVGQASVSDDIKTVTVIGTLNQASESLSRQDSVFALLFLDINGDNENPILITGIPNAPADRRAVLSAEGTQKMGIAVYLSAVRFEHIEISGSPKRGLYIGMNSNVTLGPGSLVKNNSGGGVRIGVPENENALKAGLKPGALTLDGGIIENNKCKDAGGGIWAEGAFTMKRGSIRNNRIEPDVEGYSMGGGICVTSEESISIEGGDISRNTAKHGGGIFILSGRVTMTGGSISGNIATNGGGGVLVAKGATFTQRGGRVSGNKAPAYPDIHRVDGTSSSSSGSSSSTPRPASPPRQSEGSLSIADEPPPPDRSTPSRPSRSSVDFGFTARLGTYIQGWHQNLVSFGVPLQLGMELELPVITLDLLAEASGGLGYGNLLEYHLGGMAELYFFRTIGIGAGMGLYGSGLNWGIGYGSFEEDPINYAPPITTRYYRFALIFQGTSKTTLYSELYGDGKWGFGLMFVQVMTD